MATTNALTGLLVCACLVLSVHAQFTNNPTFRTTQFTIPTPRTIKPAIWNVPIWGGRISPDIRPSDGSYGIKITFPFGRRRRSTEKRDTAGEEVNRTVSLRCDVDNADHLVALIALMNNELTTSGRNPADFFRRLDADGDGALSREELQKYVIEAFGLTS